MLYLVNMLWVNKCVEDTFRKHLHDPQVILHCLYEQLGDRAADARSEEDDLHFPSRLWPVQDWVSSQLD